MEEEQKTIIKCLIDNGYDLERIDCKDHLHFCKVLSKYYGGFMIGEIKFARSIIEINSFEIIEHKLAYPSNVENYKELICLHNSISEFEKEIKELQVYYSDNLKEKWEK